MIRQIGESAARAVVHTAIRQSPTVYVAGANGGGNDIRRWKAVKDFWIGYFERAGARLGGYSILSTAPFLAHSNLTIAAEFVFGLFLVAPVFFCVAGLKDSRMSQKTGARCGCLFNYFRRNPASPVKLPKKTRY